MESVILLFPHCLGYTLEEGDPVNLIKTRVFRSDLNKRRAILLPSNETVLWLVKEKQSLPSTLCSPTEGWDLSNMKISLAF